MKLKELLLLLKNYIKTTNDSILFYFQYFITSVIHYLDKLFRLKYSSYQFKTNYDLFILTGQFYNLMYKLKKIINFKLSKIIVATLSISIILVYSFYYFYASPIIIVYFFLCILIYVQVSKS